MTIFGNRDSGSISPMAGAVPALESYDPLERYDAADDHEPPATPMRGFGAPDPRRVILRVHGGDDIVLGTTEGRASAVQVARDMVHQIEQAAANGEWPQIDERFIRPGAIVSIDVQRPE